MKMTGEYRIPAPRHTVWEALNDPEILKACIPGCETFERSAENEFSAAVNAKVGPVKAKFNGKVTLSEINAPESYRISGEGQGGVAGFAKGGAFVRLAEDDAETVLSYDADAQVGGKLAQVGSRLVAGAAKKMADDFFGRFATAVGGAPLAVEGGTAAIPEEPAGEAPTAPSSSAEPAAGAAPATAAARRPAIPLAVWVVALIVIVAALLVAVVR